MAIVTGPFLPGQLSRPHRLGPCGYWVRWHPNPLRRFH